MVVVERLSLEDDCMGLKIWGLEFWVCGLGFGHYLNLSTNPECQTLERLVECLNVWSSVWTPP